MTTDTVLEITQRLLAGTGRFLKKNRHDLGRMLILYALAQCGLGCVRRLPSLCV